MKTEAKIQKMCEAAVGKKMTFRSGNTVRKNWIVVAAEFAGWRERQTTKIARFRLTVENPPVYPKRVRDEVVVETFNSLHE
jgi:hypothetical protein